MEEMIRVDKLSFESRLKTKLPCAHPLMTWLVEHCADVLNRFYIGADGRTPYQRLKGRKFVGHMLEFGSPVMFRLSGKVHEDHAGEVVRRGLARQETAHGEALGNEGGWAGGEVEGSERNQPTFGNGGL